MPQFPGKRTLSSLCVHRPHSSLVLSKFICFCSHEGSGFQAGAESRGGWVIESVSLYTQHPPHNYPVEACAAARRGLLASGEVGRWSGLTPLPLEWVLSHCLSPCPALMPVPGRSSLWRGEREGMAGPVRAGRALSMSQPDYSGDQQAFAFLTSASLR